MYRTTISQQRATVANDEDESVPAAAGHSISAPAYCCVESDSGD